MTRSIALAKLPSQSRQRLRVLLILVGLGSTPFCGNATASDTGVGDAAPARSLAI